MVDKVFHGKICLVVKLSLLETPTKFAWLLCNLLTISGGRSTQSNLGRVKLFRRQERRTFQNGQ